MNNCTFCRKGISTIQPTDEFYCNDCEDKMSDAAVLTNGELYERIFNGIKMQEETFTEKAMIDYNIALNEMKRRKCNLKQLGELRSNYFEKYDNVYSYIDSVGYLKII